MAASAAASGWKIVIVDYPLPDLDAIPEQNRGAAEAMLAIWRDWFGPKDGDGNTDYENFFEQAARLQAVIAECDPETTFIATLSDAPARRISDRHERPKRDLADHARYGPIGRMEALPAQERLAASYHRYDAFLRHAGRLAIPCGVDLDDPDETTLTQALHKVIPASGGDFWVKIMLSAKYGIHHIQVPVDTAAPKALDVVDESLVWALVHASGRPKSLLVQAHAVMTHEYRVFIVDHQPVTAAACIEEFTPLDNLEPFDPQFRVHRSAGTPVIRDEAARDALVAFAVAVAAELRAEVPELRDYVMDVALGADSQPLVIELNGLQNAGLYASDTRRTLRALMAAGWQPAGDDDILAIRVDVH
ncbi:hypothetical protein GCM10025867_49540 (plasmid) [Frondihabitans sucicola]|uniref:ATP-grasp domain-containing protein n=1 Tax=Frondihabitans sucicola TaxID=1268041 RepID=A0ABM8GW82_9MICO|nr:ATP-grasp domain-containing protein [Frondihabitans sucicola]BDZ52713.1 hypothetical protein GCM10025867_49540 [Frondihabitans sucicola]